MVERHNTFKMLLMTFFSSSVSTIPIHVLHHSSHFNSVAVWHAKESDIVLFILVPHITYEIQPPSNIGPIKLIGITHVMSHLKPILEW